MPVISDGVAFTLVAGCVGLLARRGFVARSWRSSVAVRRSLVLVPLVLAAMAFGEGTRMWAGTLGQVGAWGLALGLLALIARSVRGRRRPGWQRGSGGAGSGDRSPLLPDVPLVGAARPR